MALAGCATRPTTLSQPVATAPPIGKQYQWLLGSGEAAVLSRETYAAMAAYAIAQAEALRAGRAVDGAVLTEGTTPEAPAWASCAGKPAAVILDVDETALLNTGANYDSARRGDPPFDPARWDAYEQASARLVEPVPGGPQAIAAMRAAGITPIFVSNRVAANAGATRDALAAVGYGAAEPGRTLLSRADMSASGGKDGRRAQAAASFCVVAMTGDQLGDFSDWFNQKGLAVQARRARAQTAGVAARWGHGWFLLPNPMYGPGVAGGVDDLFPMDKRWPGPAGEKK